MFELLRRTHSSIGNDRNHDKQFCQVPRHMFRDVPVYLPGSGFQPPQDGWITSETASYRYLGRALRLTSAFLDTFSGDSAGLVECRRRRLHRQLQTSVPMCRSSDTSSGFAKAENRPDRHLADRRWLRDTSRLVRRHRPLACSTDTCLSHRSSHGQSPPDLGTRRSSEVGSMACHQSASPYLRQVEDRICHRSPRAERAIGEHEIVVGVSFFRTMVTEIHPH